jgi:hypothetical protein
MGGTQQTLRCVNFTRTLEVLLMGSGEGSCKSQDVYEARLCANTGTGTNDCIEANNGDAWYSTAWDIFNLDGGCCIARNAFGGDEANFQCHNRLVTVTYFYCDCSDASYLRIAYGASGGASVVWEETAGAAIEAFRVLCEEGTVFPKLLSSSAPEMNPNIPPEQYEPGGACEDHPAPLCDFGAVGDRGSCAVRLAAP